jgi:hypothetical protein
MVEMKVEYLVEMKVDLAATKVERMVGMLELDDTILF